MTQGPSPQRVRVAAVHGSLECAGRHVLVGHFKGTPIAGAEAFLDERLGGRLTTRQLLGRYPEDIEDAVVVDTPHPTLDGRPGYPPGGIVVVLDLPGELTREKLARAVAAGLVTFAIRALEERRAAAAQGPPEALAVAAVPVGTSGVGAVAVEIAVAALVDGVTLANENLNAGGDLKSGTRPWDHVRIGDLEIVEVMSDRAEQVAHALRRVRGIAQVDPGGHTELVLADRVLVREGGLPAARRGPDSVGDWQRVIVRDLRRERKETTLEETETVLEFTAIGRRARSDATQVRIDRRTVEKLVRGAVRDARPSRQVGDTLYELLLPNDLKTDLARHENLQLVVDENTADLPWEALTAPFGGRTRELAVRGGFLRQFRDTERTRPSDRSAGGLRALVVGNPPAPEGFAPLHGASAEAATVARTLASKFEVSALVWDDDGTSLCDDFPATPGTVGERVVHAAFSHPWRILHVAAHGRFDPGAPSESGVVLDEETTLTANVIRQLDAVPELVFLNCCHLGKVGESAAPEERHRFAAGVARELMRLGVHAVIAAGWAVDDDAAVLFAETFYDRLLAGAFLGTAVQQSREAIRHRFPDSATWAAYQCYGDPGYRLFGAEAPPERHPDVVSAEELVRRLRTIAVLAGKVGLPDFAELTARASALVDELDGRRREAEACGWTTPTVYYHLGAAFGELGAYGRAVECYRRAWDHPASSEAPVRLLEQLGNFEVRLAQRRARRSHAGRPAPGGDDVAALLEAAEAHLCLALSLGETAERLAMLGSFHKKAATLATGGRHEAHLAASVEHYRRSAGLGPEPRPYHFLNWLQMAAVAEAPVPAEATATLESIARRTAGRVVDEPEDFWARVASADVVLTRHLLGQPVDPEELRNRYAWAFATRSSRRDRDSVVDHLRDVADLCPGIGMAELAGGLSPPHAAVE